MVAESTAMMMYVMTVKIKQNILVNVVENMIHLCGVVMIYALIVKGMMKIKKEKKKEEWKKNSKL